MDNGEKYVFISYAHKDFGEVEKILVALKHAACNLWFDTGIESGSQWSEDIALHLLNSEVVLWFVSKASIESKYVMGEINFAVNHDKKIIPVYIENVPMPLGIEILLGQIQAVTLYNVETVAKKRNTLVSALPPSVFFQSSVPFFVSGQNVFFINDTSTEFPEGTYFAGETLCSYEFGFSPSGEAEKQTKLFGFRAAGAYDMSAKITSVIPVRDKYVSEIDDSVALVNVSLTFMAKYPVPWPDFDAALTVAIFDSASDAPQYEPLCAKILTVDDKSPQANENAYAFVKNKFDELLSGIVKK